MEITLWYEDIDGTTMKFEEIRAKTLRALGDKSLCWCEKKSIYDFWETRA